jgi:hypothetical protein
MGVEGRQGFAGLRLDEDDGVPFLVNLHSDPQLSEKVKYRVREGELTIGSSPECDIQLGGVYILDVHCSLQCTFVAEGAPAAHGALCVMRCGGGGLGGGGFPLFQSMHTSSCFPPLPPLPRWLGPAWVVCVHLPPAGSLRVRQRRGGGGQGQARGQPHVAHPQLPHRGGREPLPPVPQPRGCRGCGGGAKGLGIRQ